MMKQSAGMYMGAIAALVGIIWGCNAITTPDGPGLLVDTGFTSAGPGTGGTGGTIGSGGDTLLEGTDDVELPAEETRSFFTAFQVDPVAEDTAGPKFVISADIDQDGLLDLVSAWNQSQPVQLHLQRRDPAGTISFRTITIAGTSPLAIIAGIEVGQINADGWLDIVVLSKASGFLGLCPGTPPAMISNLEGEIVVYFNPGTATLVPDGDQWTQMILVNPYVQDRWIHNQFPGIESAELNELRDKPENGGFTSLVVGDMDLDGFDDIIVALNPGACRELGQEPPVNTIDLWLNPAGALSENSASWGTTTDIALSRNAPLSIESASGPNVTDLALSDIDDDGDLDIVAAYSIAISRNVRWYRNPLDTAGGINLRTGFSDGGADICVGGPNDGNFCPNADPDCAGIANGTCTGGTCAGGANPGAVCQNNAGCLGTGDGICTPQAWHLLPSTAWELRPIGQVDSNANVIAIGDIDNDGADDVLVRSTPGQIVQWFRKPTALVVSPEFPPNDPVPNRFNFPWTVFTLTEFSGQEPEAIAIGDLTGNLVNEVLVAVEGGVFWYDSTVGLSLFDPWLPSTIIQDSDDGGGDGTSASGTVPGSGVGATGVDTTTTINSLLIVDLDGDGRNDIVGTLDRKAGAGLSDDRLVWYRNTRD